MYIYTYSFYYIYILSENMCMQTRYVIIIIIIIIYIHAIHACLYMSVYREYIYYINISVAYMTFQVLSQHDCQTIKYIPAVEMFQILV